MDNLGNNDSEHYLARFEKRVQMVAEHAKPHSHEMVIIQFELVQKEANGRKQSVLQVPPLHIFDLENTTISSGSITYMVLQYAFQSCEPAFEVTIAREPQLIAEE
ncbi:hypothetical protein MPER_11664 [Moniliophthora perniciosa FA553]|nr:hypothetical protein MPER_11664 [Moniliophthora perniciosa FA553]